MKRTIKAPRGNVELPILGYNKVHYIRLGDLSERRMLHIRLGIDRQKDDGLYGAVYHRVLDTPDYSITMYLLQGSAHIITYHGNAKIQYRIIKRGGEWSGYLETEGDIPESVAEYLKSVTSPYEGTDISLAVLHQDEYGEDEKYWCKYYNEHPEENPYKPTNYAVVMALQRWNRLSAMQRMSGYHNDNAQIIDRYKVVFGIDQMDPRRMIDHVLELYG